MKSESSGFFENVAIIESLPAVKEALIQLDREQLLIVHQTHLPNAKKITFEDPYFSHSGLVGTALIRNPDSVIQVAEEMNKPPAEQGYGMIHKGADAQVIMTFSKQLAAELLEKGEMQKVSLDGIDNYLSDLAVSGEIDTWGMPNKYVYGYIHAGNLILNPKYNPTNAQNE